MAGNDFQIVGARIGAEVYFQRDPVDGVPQPCVEWGCISSVTQNPDNTIEDVFCGAGGQQTLVRRVVSQNSLSYDIEMQGLNPDNLALSFSADPPSLMTKVAGQLTVKHYGHDCRRICILDADYDQATPGEATHTIASVDSVIIGTLAAIVPTLSTIAIATVGVTTTTTLTFSAAHGLAVGDIISLTTGVAAGNAGSYVVESAPTGTTITIAQLPGGGSPLAGGAETGLTAPVSATNGATALVAGVDYRAPTDRELKRGILCFEDGAFAPATSGDVFVTYTQAAVSRDRAIWFPNTSPLINGEIVIVFGYDGYEGEFRHRGRVSITPNTPLNAIFDGDSTMTVNAAFLDTETGRPQGIMEWCSGSIPECS